ncbi:MAG: GNAT family N-acetyltransferase [Firmicutes bacterium]|nr:GNAT family N-acetyltransferase [Bacillota bacterium]
MLNLYIPTVEDLWFREKMLADEETMSYNHAWGGTILFPESEWQSWYDHWILCDDGKWFYRYLREVDSGEFVGEIAYHFDEARSIWLANVIIIAEHRGKGYGKQGLKILCELAAKNGIEILYDDIAIDNPALSLFIDNGFIEEYRTDDIIMLKKDLFLCD